MIKKLLVQISLSIIVVSSTCFAKQRDVTTSIGIMREQQLIAREQKEVEQNIKTLTQRKKFIDHNMDLVDTTIYQKVMDTIPGIYTPRQAAKWCYLHPKESETIGEVELNKMMKKAGIPISKLALGQTQSIVNSVQKILSQFILKEKQLNSIAEVKEWMAKYPKETETIKYYLIGKKLSLNERTEVCNKLFSKLIPAAYQIVKNIDKTLIGEIPLSDHVSLDTYKASVSAARNEIIATNVPQEWYWLIRNSITRPDIKEDLFYKELPDCCEILNKTPTQIVQEYAI